MSDQKHSFKFNTEFKIISGKFYSLFLSIQKFPSYCMWTIKKLYKENDDLFLMVTLRYEWLSRASQGYNPYRYKAPQRLDYFFLKNKDFKVMEGGGVLVICR